MLPFSLGPFTFILPRSEESHRGLRGSDWPAKDFCIFMEPAASGVLLVDSGFLRREGDDWRENERKSDSMNGRGQDRSKFDGKWGKGVFKSSESVKESEWRGGLG